MVELTEQTRKAIDEIGIPGMITYMPIMGTTLHQPVGQKVGEFLFMGRRRCQALETKLR
jgi:hypothetical protein